MTIEQFIMKYQPFMCDGDIRQFDWTVEHEYNEIQKAHKENKLCTVVEGDDDIMYLTGGFHYINRQFYVITKHVIEEEDLTVPY